MPNCFQFTRPGSDEPTPLVEVEAQLLEDLGIPAEQIDPVRWHSAFTTLQMIAAFHGDNDERIERCFESLKLEPEREAVYRTYLRGPRFMADAWAER